MKKRLEKANGTSANHVSVVEDNRFGLYSAESPLLRHAVTQMDRWLTNLGEDTSDAPRIEKIVRAQPAELQEGCNTRDAIPTFVPQRLDRDAADSCEQLYPSNSFPREVAGADIAADVIKCQLKPLTPADYTVTFTSDEWARLEGIFPQGVCDWSRPGVEQQRLVGTWIHFN